MDPLRPSTLALPNPTPTAGAAEAKPRVPFADKLGAALGEANRALQQADQAGQAVATGEGDVVDAMVAVGRADISLRLVLSLRNRLLEAYQEIMRLQL